MKYGAGSMFYFLHRKNIILQSFLRLYTVHNSVLMYLHSITNKLLWHVTVWSCKSFAHTVVSSPDLLGMLVTYGATQHNLLAHRKLHSTKACIC